MRVMEKQSINNWIELLEGVDPASKSSKVAKRILKLASLPKRRRVAVDLNKLSRNAAKDENIVIPGKVLSTGSVDKKFALSAIGYSGAAAAKLKAAGCSMLSLEEMLKKEKIRVIM